MLATGGAIGHTKALLHICKFLVRTDIFIQKGCIFITKNLQSKTQGPSPSELARLISGAQKRDQSCIDALCLFFQPLIYKEGRRQTVYNALGEDGVNIAWVIFLKFIYRYNGADYENLPGLIRCHLRYELLHAMQQQGEVWDSEELSTMEEGTAASTVAAEDINSRILTRLSFAQEIKTLSPACRKVWHMVYVANHNNSVAAALLNCTEGNIRYHLNCAHRHLYKALKNTR